jgi:type IV pilus biogenesis protein CpaD/CtpE
MLTFDTYRSHASGAHYTANVKNSYILIVTMRPIACGSRSSALHGTPQSYCYLAHHTLQDAWVPDRHH